MTDTGVTGTGITDIANRAQHLAAAPDRSAWVTASAGSGKTKILVERVLTLMLSGARPQAILCLTFTNAAAAEMAIRINRELGKWATCDAAELNADLGRLLGSLPDAERRRHARRLFARVLDVPGGMKIMTLHAFCQSVLRRFPVEAGIAPHFELMSERDSADALDQATLEVLGALAGGRADLAAAIDHVTARVHRQNFAKLLGDLRDGRTIIADLMARHGGLDGLIAHTYDALGVTPGDTRDSLIAEAAADGAFDRAALARAVPALEQGSKATDQPRARLIASWLAGSDADRADAFDAYARAFLTQKDQPLAAAKMRTAKAVAALADLPDIMEAEQARIAATVGRIKSAGVARATAAVLTLGDAILHAYWARKTILAHKDFDDLILDTARLLTRSGIAPWVLYKLDGGIEHILIDEAQDTSAVQWTVVRALADEFFTGRGARDEGRELARTMFAVGDVKQSIFSFQQADPYLFGEYQAHFRTLAAPAGHRWEDVPLQVSFRSNRPITQAVDAVFTVPSARDGVVDPGVEMHHLAAREKAGGRVELWNLVKPLERDDPPTWKPPVEGVAGDSPRTRLAELLARRIRRWLDDEELLESKGRPIRPGDIMILVRRRDALVTDTVRALKDLDVPVSGVDRMILTDQLAIQDLMALGHFLLLPEDDLTLATVLKGPLFNLDEDAIFSLAHGRDGTLWQALARGAADNSDMQRAHAGLASLRARVDFERPYEFYATLLAQGARAAILARLGVDAADPLNEFLALAIEYERGGTSSLQGFLHWLETGAAQVKRDLDRAAGAVRIMTVHGAKGLEAPIVILPDTGQVPRGRDNFFWSGEKDVLLWPPTAQDRDPLCIQAAEAAHRDMMREHNRLLYVAMTRAEDRLYICGWRNVQQPPQDCWYELVSQGIEALAHEVRDPFLADFPATIDPTVRRIDAAQQEPPIEDGDPAADAAPAPLPAWALVPPPPEPAPPRPLAPSRPALAEPAAISPLSPSDPSISGPAADRRFRRGRLIHALLQYLPDLDAPARSAAGERYLAAMAGDLDAAGRRDLMTEVETIFTDPALAALFGPGSLAEVPITGLVEFAQGAAPFVVSGQIDRLLVAPDRVLVVDFKSNRPPPEEPADVPAIYLRQMAAYRALLADIYPGRTIDCALLWTVGPRWMALGAAALEQGMKGLTADAPATKP